MTAKRLTPREQVQKRIDVLSKLLDNPAPLYPVACHCLTKSVLSADHAEDCVYRLTREILRDVQRSQSETQAEPQKCKCDVHPWCPIHGSEANRGGVK